MPKIDYLIRTKLRLPFTRPDQVSRPRLHKRIKLGIREPLTMITAPADFGKTTNGAFGSPWRQSSPLRKILLACGILSSPLYIAATILGALQWPGYNSASQSVSELIGIDAPSAPFVIPLFAVYSLLIYAFGLGIWISAGQKQSLRIAAVLIVIKEVLGLAGLFFAPMHLRGAEPTFSDTLHIILTGVGVLLCMFPAMGFGAAASGKRFRIYTIITMLIFLIFGTLAGMDGPQVAANLPTPLLGIFERINIFGYLLWIVVFGTDLINSSAHNRNSG